MGDILFYRIPGEDVVKRYGIFKDEPCDSFVVANSIGTKKWYFHEDYSKFELHDNTSLPHVFTKAEYLEKATEFINRIKGGIAEKLVLSRVVKSKMDSTAEKVFERLVNDYPNAFVYLISSEFFGTWIGATPEKLITGDKDFYSTMSLAGTRSIESEINWEEKEYHEQRLVTKFIIDRLKGISEDVILSELEEHQAGPVKHLKNEISFKSTKSPLELAELLHPTPAVAGLPQEVAVRYIMNHEGYERSLYTGYIGVLGERSNLYVNLRCMQLINGEAYLYVGGGLTSDSVPEEEWKETENKAKTILNTLQNL